MLPLYVLAAGIAGAVVGGIPGVLKARFGAHEVITTIMLNFIVLALLNYLISTRFKVHDTLHTAEIRSGAMPRLSDFAAPFHGSAANTVLVLALVVAAASWWLLFRARAGFELRAVGLQPHAAEYAGVNVAGMWWRAISQRVLLDGDSWSGRCRSIARFPRRS